VLNGLVQGLPTLVGGSADLSPSTDTYLQGHGDLGLDEYCGHNMHFGVREHAMGNIVNGMALHGGVLAYGGTFLIFSDYMRPAIRLAAINDAHSIFIFTHDSIGLGQDGPTHQPIEHLAALRAIPRLTILRPADANETAACWRLAIERNGPCALVLTRQALPVLQDRERIREGVPRGAYVLAEAGGGQPDVLLIATGSELSLALAGRKLLEGRGVRTRVVSMPSWEVFEEQPKQYYDSVLPPAVRARVTIEAATPMGWRQYAGDAGATIGIDHFGASAPGEVLFEKFGFTPEAVAAKAQEVVARVGAEGGRA
jgi:transketolase